MLEQTLAAAQRELNSTSHELHWAHLTIQKKDAVIRLLEERLRKQRIGFLGPASETLSDLQLELLVEEEPSTTREEVEAEARREPVVPPRERKPHPGRKPLPEDLPRIEEVIACEANCTHCGEPTKLIGYDTSEVLDREPAKWFVRVTKRQKRACGKCSEVRMAELAPRIVEKGLASDRVVIETVVAKYCDHLPLYRQEAMIEREAGPISGRKRASLTLPLFTRPLPSHIALSPFRSPPPSADAPASATVFQSTAPC